LRGAEQACLARTAEPLAIGDGAEHPSAILTAELVGRLEDLWERTGDPALGALLAGRVPLETDGAFPSADALPPLDECVEQELSDWVSTALMACYRRSGDRQVFGLLHELNAAQLRVAVRAQIRRSGVLLDPDDIVQEVFLSIFRYPSRFVPERADAFRNWAHRIARNTVFKQLKAASRRARWTPLDAEVEQHADPQVASPDRSAADAEAAVLVDRAFLLWLNLYLVHFEKLSERERLALTRVEVDGLAYREVAAELGIRLENLKMVVFRGRRKILRGMSRSLARLARDFARPREAADGAPADLGRSA
jgi:RNA polymerase sigma factor (sigma-70 family)